MSTFDSAAVWSATSLAFDEKKIGAAGLSVRQRKLLSLLSQPASLPQLAQSIALPVEDVQAALERFVKLGFVQSSEEVPLNPMQTRLRSHSAAESPSRMPMMIGVAVAVVAAIGAGAWLLRGGSPSATQAPVATSATKAATPTATGPSDTADNGLLGPVTRTAAAPAVAAVAAAAPVPTPAAAAAALARPTVTPPAATAAVVAVPTKAAATPAIAPTAASAAATPAATAPTTPALTLATALPAAPAASAAQPAAAPAVVAPAAVAPATQVANAPSASPPAAAARPAPAAAREIKLINRVEPTFPRGNEADKGTVRARLQVNAQGAVTGVDIVEASPPRVFDRTVRSALQQWRYEPTGEAFSVIAEINFSR